MRITVFVFHPFPRRSKANRALNEGINTCEGILIRDLYELYPSYSIDVDAEKKVLEETDIVVFQHPFYWYNCPPLMKLWLDEVLELGWAYGKDGTALKNKKWIQVITTGGPEEAYDYDGTNDFKMKDYLRPFERTARLCGMQPLEPFIVHGSHNLDEKDLAIRAVQYRELIERMKFGELPPVYSTK